MARTRTLALLAALLVVAGCSSGAPVTCSAWHCSQPASAPLAWTRPDGGRPGMLDVSRTGDLCERHAKQSPFVLAGRFLLVFGIVPAFAFGYIAFRVLWIFDKHGPGLAWLGERNGRRVLFGVPLAVVGGWLVFFLVRAW